MKKLVISMLLLASPITILPNIKKTITIKEENENRKSIQETIEDMELEQMEEEKLTKCSPKNIEKLVIGAGTAITTIAGIVINIILFFAKK